MVERKPQARDRIWGARLRAIRTERCELALEPAAALAGWHGSKLSRTERGLRTVSIEDAATLLTAWKLPAAERERVLEELVSGSTSGWWDRPIPGVPGDVGTLASYEAVADELIAVATAAVPGLLQTRESATAILAADDVPAYDIERRWMARRQRQRVLARVECTVFITETALRTPWGGHEAWRNQLSHLLYRQDIGVGIRVIPERQTAVLLLQSWLWMRLRNAPPVVHVELADGATYIHEADRYTTILTRLDDIALPNAGSRKMITGLMKGEVT